MLTASIAVTVLTIIATGGIAICDFLRAKFVLANAAEVGVPPGWLPLLGVAKAAGAVGLALGLAGLTALGLLAAIGLCVFFAGAIAAHVRAGVYHNIAFPLGYFALATGSLVVALVE